MKLNLCSGPSMWPGSDWIHIDRVDQSSYIKIMRDEYRAPEMRATLPEHQRRLAEYLGAGGTIDSRVHDVCEPLSMFSTGSIDAIYLGQCVEHVNPLYQLPKIFLECHRLLRQGGGLRITTPDLDILLDSYRLGRMHQFANEQPAFYAEAAPEAQLCYLMYGSTGPYSTFSNYEGHMFCFTRGTLAAALTEAGFSGPYHFGKKSEAFSDAIDCGESHSIFMEATK